MVDPAKREEQVPAIGEPAADDAPGTPELVQKTTHEVDTDDMFGMNGE